MIPRPVILLLCQYFLHTINSEVEFISTTRSWDAAETDCQSRGSHLLTATAANTANNQDCIDQATSNILWIGLNRIQDGSTWKWSSGVEYVENEVNWGNNNPRSSYSDCAVMKASGNGAPVGTIRHRGNNINECSDAKTYCCESGSTVAPTTSTASSTSTDQETIICGETKEGTRRAGDEIEFTFTSTKSYNEVYLEGCKSTHDIWLEILDANRNTIADADDETAHGDQTNCGNQYAGDITIPGSVSIGNTYTFIVKGYQDTSGDYSVELFCSEPTNEPTTAPVGPPVFVTSPPTTDCGPRIRKEWNTASQDDRDLYINGLLELSQRQILQVFTEQHGEFAAERQAHGTSAFLPWHRLFLLELENAIRNLGDEYKCFSLLYWNWALDASENGQQYTKYSILNSGLGSTGTKGNNYCVTDGAFAVGSYTPHYCDNQDWRASDGSCCLRRRTMSRVSGNIDTISEMVAAIENDDFYGTDADDVTDGFRENVEYSSHGNAHCTMGTCGSTGGHLGNGRFSPDDPIFYLLHTYVDFTWAIWQDSNDYDLVHKDNIYDDIYDGTSSEKSDLDDTLIFDVIIDKEYYWSTLTGNERVRDVHNIEDLNVKYEKGSFFEDAEIDESNINSNWFVDNSNNARRMMNYDQTAKEFEKNEYKQLVKQYGDEYAKTKEGRKKIVRAWAKMQCEFKNSGERECERPQYFDDCSGMGLVKNELDKYDIDITLEELIEKVEDYPCMVETRKMFYEWAKGFGLLKKLCRGDFDRFCEKQFLKGKKKDKCLDRKFKQKKKNVLYGDATIEDIDGNNYGVVENKYDFETIMFNAVANGFVLTIIGVFVWLVWDCCKRMKMSQEYEKVKYMEDGV